jgi:hypothetical protein
VAFSHHLQALQLGALQKARAQEGASSAPSTTRQFGREPPRRSQDSASPDSFPQDLFVSTTQFRSGASLAVTRRLLYSVQIRRKPDSDSSISSQSRSGASLTGTRESPHQGFFDKVQIRRKSDSNSSTSLSKSRSGASRTGTQQASYQGSRVDASLPGTP